jgi:uncharacterized repeat protein (TIGR01451 family)
MLPTPRPRLLAALLITAGLLVSSVAAVAAMRPLGPARAPTADAAASARLSGPPDGARPNHPPADEEEEEEEGDGRDHPDERDRWFYMQRSAGTNRDFTLLDAAVARSRAAAAVLAQRAGPRLLAAAPAAFDGAWRNVGPDPIASGSNAYAGRVQALAVRSSAPYTIYLGAAQGGLWVSSTLTSRWISRSDAVPTQAIGDIALAPSNEDIVYVGTGEGAGSGDSYFGDGVFRSDDGGRTFRKVSGEAILQSSISKVVVDPRDPQHVYIATVRGVSGLRSVSPPNNTPYGIWESTDGGTSWRPLYTTTERLRGAVDLVMDPQQPDLLIASFLSQGLVKTTDGGKTWRPAMQGLPANADWANATVRTRIALGLSRPSADRPAVVYAGFNWADTTGRTNPSTVWKSTDAGDTWTETTRQGISGYCGGQCWYDNVILADPTNADILYVLGVWNYGTGSGGIFRSMDGGRSWTDLGYGQHPDYHAIALRRDKPEYVVVGNDGGAWSSPVRGGRLNGEPYTRTVWANLNGRVKAAEGEEDPQVEGYGTMTAQYVGVAQHPANPELIYGGTQDNGTHRRLAPGDAFRIIHGGDGGNALVDPYEPRYVYGTEYNISPYRFSEGAHGGASPRITNGITTSDRSAFYIPWLIDPEITNRLYLGSFRVYRTEDRGDHWQPISGDLTGGCPSSATSPTGYACVITAFGATAGSGALYVGTGDGRVVFSADATVARPTWTRVEKAPMPARPVTAIAVDRSNDRVALVGFGGFNGATPAQPGHVYRTTDAGRTWADVTGDLPDAPVNSVLIDASEPSTYYAGTDVGPLVTRDGGQHWVTLGETFPVVAVWQLNLNPYTRQIVAGTHGRGIWTLRDEATRVPALQVRAFDGGLPIGPGSLLTLTVQVRNVGNAPATAVAIRNPLPPQTTFVSATDGGSLDGTDVVWDGQSVPVSGTLRVAVTVRLAASGIDPGEAIVNDGLTARTGDVQATGSPLRIVTAPPAAARLTPSSQFDGTRVGRSIDYELTVENRGYRPGAFALTVTGNAWPTTVWDAAFGAPLAQTPVLAPGARYRFGLRVEVPADATDGLTDEATVVATAVQDPTATATAKVTTQAVVDSVLLVDGSTDEPDVTAAYASAVHGNGYAYDLWDLSEDGDLPERFMNAHPVLVWWTGSSYPGPLLRYEALLARHLDRGGRLFLSGMDLLDQEAGTTDFVKRYLHVDWDGTERQNDVGTTYVTAVPTNTIVAGLGQLPLDVAALYDNDFSNQITPIAPALAAFRDDKRETDALTVEDGVATPYRIMFLAWPFEALSAAGDRQALMGRALDWFGLPRRYVINLPVVLDNPRTSPW